MQQPCAWYNDYCAFKAFLDGATPINNPTVYQTGMMPDLLGGGHIFHQQPTAMIVTAPEDPPWPPAWIWPTEPTMKQLQGFATAVVLFLALINYGRFSWLIWGGGILYIFRVLTIAAMKNAVYEKEEKLRQEGRLLPKAGGNPIYNIVPIQP